MQIFRQTSNVLELMPAHVHNHTPASRASSIDLRFQHNKTVYFFFIFFHFYFVFVLSFGSVFHFSYAVRSFFAFSSFARCVFQTCFILYFVFFSRCTRLLFIRRTYKYINVCMNQIENGGKNVENKTLKKRLLVWICLLCFFIEWLEIDFKQCSQSCNHQPFCKKLIFRCIK